MAKQKGGSTNQNLLATLTYSLGFITGILFLLIEKKNKFIRFHAMQSTLAFGGLFVLSIVLGYVPLGWLAGLFVPLISTILWILLMIKAFNGERYKLPYIGVIAEKRS